MTIDRKQGLGGSDVSSALGLDPRCTPYQLWRRKLGLDKEFEGNAATRRGNFLEASILRSYAAEIQPAQLITGIEHVDEWRYAHLDARAVMPDGQCRVVEAKSVGKHALREWGDPGSDEMPDRVLCQALWYSGMDAAQLVDIPVAIVPDDPDEVLGLTADEVMALSEFRIYRVVPVLELEVRLVAKARLFWERHVMAKVPPPVTTPEDIKLRWPAHLPGKARVATVEVEQLIAQHVALGKAVREGDAARERIKAQLMQFAEDCEFIVDTRRRPLLTLKSYPRKGYSVAEALVRSVKATALGEALQITTETQPILETPKP